MMHQALDDSDQTRESMASLIHDTSPTLRHSLQQTHNKSSYYGFRDIILSHLVTIIKHLVHHAVYCISLSCLLPFLCNPYIPFLIYQIFHLLVIIMYAQELVRAKGLKEWQTLLSLSIAINNNYYSHTDWYLNIYIQYCADIQACYLAKRLI